MVLKSLETFAEIASSKPKKKIAVAAAEDEQVLQAVTEASKRGIVEPILVGDVEKINKISNEMNIDLGKCEIINEKTPANSSKICVELIRDGKAHIIMKGYVGTADYLKAILNKEKGLRKGDLLSHIGFFELKAYHKVIALTDAAQNIAPTFDEKVGIIKNSIDLYHRLGIENPKIAVIAAVETVNQKMPVTIDAANLTMMNKRKQIKDRKSVV